MSRLSEEELKKAKTNGWHCFGETLASCLGADGKNYWNKDWRIAAGHVMSPPLNPDPNTKIYMM